MFYFSILLGAKMRKKRLLSMSYTTNKKSDSRTSSEMGHYFIHSGHYHIKKNGHLCRKACKNKLIMIEINTPVDLPHQAVYDKNNERISIDYSDDDIMIVDNVKQIVDIMPIRMSMNCIILCVNGQLQVDINGKTSRIQKNQLLLCPPNTFMENFLFSVDFECKALCLTNRILQTFLHSRINVWNHVMYVNKLKVCPLHEKDIHFADKLYDSIRACLDYDGQSPYRKEVLQSLICGAIMGLCGMLSLGMGPLPEERQAGENIFHRFLELMQQTPVKHQTVEYYAAQLCITPKYLSVVCKKNSDKTANQWIQEYTLSDIIYYLRSTDYSIKEISNKMGFPNSSFFGKYVKEHTGMPPKMYREQYLAKRG